MDIKLLDDNTYTFKPLPFCKKSVALMERMETEPVSALLDAITYSLSLTYGNEKAEEIVESGVIPFPKQGNPLMEQITSAIFPSE